MLHEPHVHLKYHQNIVQKYIGLPAMPKLSEDHQITSDLTVAKPKVRVRSRIYKEVKIFAIFNHRG